MNILSTNVASESLGPINLYIVVIGIVVVVLFAVLMIYRLNILDKKSREKRRIQIEILINKINKNKDDRNNVGNWIELITAMLMNDPFSIINVANVIKKRTGDYFFSCIRQTLAGHDAKSIQLLSDFLNDREVVGLMECLLGDKLALKRFMQDFQQAKEFVLKQ